MDKIAVVGNAGGGKTTLSLALCRTLGIPYFSVDKAQFRPCWEPVPLADLTHLHEEWLSRPRWLIDGWGDATLLHKRLAAADTIILIEHPLWRHCWWAFKRQCSGLISTRTDMPEGCPPLAKTWRLLKTLRWGHRHGLPLVRQALSTLEGTPGRTVRRLRSPAALEAFLREAGGGHPPRPPN